jgi:hypothetical protein
LMMTVIMLLFCALATRSASGSIGANLSARHWNGFLEREEVIHRIADSIPAIAHRIGRPCF